MLWLMTNVELSLLHQPSGWVKVHSNVRTSSIRAGVNSRCWALWPYLRYFLQRTKNVFLTPFYREGQRGPESKLPKAAQLLSCWAGTGVQISDTKGNAPPAPPAPALLPSRWISQDCDRVRWEVTGKVSWETISNRTLASWWFSQGLPLPFYTGMGGCKWPLLTSCPLTSMFLSLVSHARK